MPLLRQFGLSCGDDYYDDEAAIVYTGTSHGEEDYIEVGRQGRNCKRNPQTTDIKEMISIKCNTSRIVITGLLV